MNPTLAQVAAASNLPFALGIAALGVAIGLGLIGYAAMNGMARQPEAIGKMQTPMIIALAFVELVFLLTVFVGGASFKGFLEKIRQDALANIPAERRERFDRLSREEIPIVADAPRPQGPGRQWTLDEVVAVAGEPHRGRDFARGEAMYRAAACAACHRFAAFPGDGAGGPDLTGVGNRFGPRELAEAIVAPSATVSDQYRFTEFELADGRLVVGRLLSEENGKVRLAENLLAPQATTELDAATIIARRPATISPMMAGLVDPLSRDELADLIAYLQSGGDPRAPAFSR